MSGAEQDMRDGRWTLGVRVIPDQVSRARWRNTLTYRFHPRVTAGVEYNPLADDVSPLGNLLAISETESRPALILGTSSDRIGTPSGQSFYATLSKSLKLGTGFAVAPYSGVAYGTYEDRFRPIAGLTLTLGKGFSSTVAFDGVHVHPLASYTYGRHVLSFILERSRNPGASYSISF